MTSNDKHYKFFLVNDTKSLFVYFIKEYFLPAMGNKIYQNKIRNLGAHKKTFWILGEIWGNLGFTCRSLEKCGKLWDILGQQKLSRIFPGQGGLGCTAIGHKKIWG